MRTNCIACKEPIDISAGTDPFIKALCKYCVRRGVMLNIEMDKLHKEGHNREEAVIIAVFRVFGKEKNATGSNQQGR